MSVRSTILDDGHALGTAETALNGADCAFGTAAAAVIGGACYLVFLASWWCGGVGFAGFVIGAAVDSRRGMGGVVTGCSEGAAKVLVC